MALSPPGAAHERVRAAVHRSVAAEFATAAAGRPMVYPLTPFYDDERERVVVTSPPAYAGKVDAVRENPEVALHLPGDDAASGLLVRGTATVDDDDLRANGEYVGRLIASEPEGEKRSAFSDNAVLDSRLGRLLMDWYTLRVVVRIDPTEVVEVPDVEGRPTLEPWPAAGLGREEATKHQRLSLGLAGGAAGTGPTPTPVRGFEVDSSGEVATLDPVTCVDASEGDPACLLLHWHTPDVKRLGQRVVRARVVGVEGGRVRLRAGSSFSMRRETRLDMLRSVLEGKRRTRAYFGVSGLSGWFF